MTHPFRRPGPTDIPGVPPAPNGQQRAQIQLPPIAMVGLVPPNIPAEPGLGPVEEVVTRTVVGMGDGSQMVCERRATRQGVHCTWLTPDDAIEVGRILIQLGRAAKSNLTLPPGARLPEIDVEAELEALAALAEQQQADAELAVAFGDRGPEIAEEPADPPARIPGRVETRETVCDRGAELHVKGDGADEWFVYPCSNDEPGHERHRADVPDSLPMAGFSWTEAADGPGWRTTVPPRVTDRRG